MGGVAGVGVSGRGGVACVAMASEENEGGGLQVGDVGEGGRGGVDGVGGEGDVSHGRELILPVLFTTESRYAPAPKSLSAGSH